MTTKTFLKLIRVEVLYLIVTVLAASVGCAVQLYVSDYIFCMAGGYICIHDIYSCFVKKRDLKEKVCTRQPLR